MKAPHHARPSERPPCGDDPPTGCRRATTPVRLARPVSDGLLGRATRTRTPVWRPCATIDRAMNRVAPPTRSIAGHSRATHGLVTQGHRGDRGTNGYIGLAHRAH